MNVISSCYLIAGVFAIALPSAADAATRPQHLRPPAASYTFGGRVYDRLFSAASLPRYMRTDGNVPHSRLRRFAVAPYNITDLVPIAGIANREGALDGYGYPTAVNNSGLITYYDECQCTGNNDNIALLFNDTATYTAILYADQNQEGESNAIPYAINASGDSAGEVTNVGPGSSHENMIDFSSTGGVLYGSGAADTTYALGVNDANTAVGHDTGAKGSFAAMFFAGPGGRVLLAPPKNVSWVGTATGINDSGEIVGYGTFATGGRALQFFRNKPAVVIPVGAAGVSTSAQAINVHGDIVGNAGSQAYLYHDNHVLYLPTPTGDTPGNAVAYALNASGEVVGDINAAPGSTSTAFLYSSGQSYDLNALLPANSGWQIVHAAGINDFGQIVGVGYCACEGGSLTAFSMKPQLPAPVAGSIVTYRKGITGVPHDIVRGPDGNMWFTETVGGSLWIAKITHDGVVTEYKNSVLHDPPDGITSGSDGNVWFGADNAIGKITPSGVITEYTVGISKDANPSSLVLGPDGNIWFVEPILDRVGKITPAGDVTEYAKGLPATDGGLGPTAITAGHDGNLWFVSNGSPSSDGTPGDAIGKITPGGNVTLYPFPGAATYLIPTHISSGSDGNVWVASYSLSTNQPGITKVTPSGGMTAYPAGVLDVDERPDGISGGPDGNVWYTETDYIVNQICKITPLGVTTCYANGVSMAPGSIANGGDGYLWYSTLEELRAVSKIHT